MTIKARQLYGTEYANLSTSKAPQSSAFRQCVSPIFLYLSDTHSLTARNTAHTQIFGVWYDVDVYIFENIRIFGLWIWAEYNVRYVEATCD